MQRGERLDGSSLQPLYFVYPTASLSIAEVFSGPFLFKIPYYQRPYSWTRDHAERLLDDLVEAAGIGGQAEDEYFLGTILLMDAPGTVTKKLSIKMSSREFDIVDGQQRLATLLTLLAVLRDLDGDPRGVLPKRVQAAIRATEGGPFRRTERFRLHLGRLERSMFEDAILQPGATQAPAEPLMGAHSEELLIAVRNYFRNALEVIDTAARQQLFDFVMDRCYVVAIVSHSIDRAHRMFVVLNDTGRPLQRNDILKADLLKDLSKGDEGWARPMWEDLETELGASFELFFSHLRTALDYGGPHIVESIRKVVREAGGSERFFKDVLLPHARAYKLVRSGGAGVLPPDMQAHLYYLSRLAEADWAPAAILALKDWEKDPERAAFLLAEIDRLAHLVRLLCSGSGKRVGKFAALYSSIRAGAPIDEKHPALLLTRDEERSIAYHMRDMAKRNTKVCKQALLRINDEMAGSLVKVDADRLTVEHVLPQRVGGASQWQKWFNDTEERARLVESLGNLVLIPQHENGRAKNGTWEAKKAIYEQSDECSPLLAVTRDALQYDEWRPVQIEEREARMLAIMEKLWRLDLRSERGGVRAGSAASSKKWIRPRSTS